MYKKEDLRKVKYTLRSRLELEQKGQAALLAHIADTQPRDGYFHGWATDSEIVNYGQGPLIVHHTSAIVEDKVRKNIVKVRFDLIDFVD